MAAKWLKARQTKYGAYIAVYTLVVLAILAAVNFLANRYDKSYDATKNKQYSLSRSESPANQVRRLHRGLHSGRPRYSGGGEFSGQSLRQVLRRHQEQAVQPVRPDHQDRQGPEERRQIGRAHV